jgi:hypothetical protein
MGKTYFAKWTPLGGILIINNYIYLLLIMKLTFENFLFKNCNETILATYLVYKLFSLFYEEIIYPILLNFLDPTGTIRKKTYYIGNEEIRYGAFSIYLIIISMLIYAVYFVSSIK